ncbi:DNA-directed RNA polymerase sigma-70 factor [Clostridia bacterium]|nr:DNA-directed RNA polymerase sigma-70 factor [Clostridia bacterium]
MLHFYLSMLETEEERKTMEYIYEQYYSRYMYVAMKRLNNRDLAEEAVHMAFIDMIEEKEKIFTLGCSDFLRYSDYIVRNKSIDVLRKERKYVINDDYERIPDEKPLVDEIVTGKIEQERLIAMLDTLDDDEQQLLQSKYILGKTYQEIADEMNLTLKTVEVKLYRVRKKARQLLSKEGMTVE